MKVKALATLLTLGAVTTTLLTFNGENAIEGAKNTISDFVTKLETYEGNERALVSKISELKEEIETLKEQLNNKDLVEEEKAELLEQITELQEQLKTATAELERVTADLESSTTEKERLTAELEKANQLTEELQEVLESITFNDEPLTVEQLNSIIGSSNTGKEEGVTGILWTTTGTNADYEENFLNLNSEVITNLLVTNNIETTGININVEVTNTQYGMGTVVLTVSGHSLDTTDVLTKSKINSVINTGKFSIDKVIFN